MIIATLHELLATDCNTEYTNGVLVQHLTATNYQDSTDTCSTHLHIRGYETVTRAQIDSVLGDPDPVYGQVREVINCALSHGWDVSKQWGVWEISRGAQSYIYDPRPGEDWEAYGDLLDRAVTQSEVLQLLTLGQNVRSVLLSEHAVSRGLIVEKETTPILEPAYRLIQTDGKELNLPMTGELRLDLYGWIDQGAPGNVVESEALGLALRWSEKFDMSVTGWKASRGDLDVTYTEGQFYIGDGNPVDEGTVINLLRLT